MPTNFKVFAGEIEEFKKRLLPTQFLLFQKKLALEVFSRAVKKTPVDTGRLRGGWQIGINRVPTDEAAAGDQSTELAKLASLGQNQTIFIANPVSYAVFVEEGTSRQAPMGMLAVSIQEVEINFRGVE